MYLSLSTACKDVFIIKYCFHMYYHQLLFPYVSSPSTVPICITKYCFHMYHQVLFSYVSPSTVPICIIKYCFHMYYQLLFPYVLSSSTVSIWIIIKYCYHMYHQVLFPYVLPSTVSTCICPVLLMVVPCILHVLYC